MPVLPELPVVTSAGRSTRLSVIVTLAVSQSSDAMSTPPFSRDLVMVTPDARTSSGLQSTVRASMTVPAVVMVHEPTYGVSVVPAGTPVLPGPGQQPPHGSGPPGVKGAPIHAPPACGGAAAWR
ncbi:MAG: hypothetical protein IT182_14990 [Acidobacteria bacterium]|nr:hypothetical protein [Acidobacteriota bacterium]